MMPDKTWKQRERKAALAIGAKRNVGSGSMGRADKSRSDSTHGMIFLECKHRKKHSAVTLWDDTKAKAAKEGKTPIVSLTEHKRPGCWYVVRDCDVPLLAEILAEAARKAAEIEAARLESC